VQARQRSRRAMVVILFLVYLILACSPLKEPTPAPASTPTTLATSEPTSILLLPTDTPVPGPASAATRAPAGGLLRLYGQEPVTLDPALAGDTHSHEYIGKIFSGLVRLSGDLEVLPDIAERWEVDASHTVYTFYLRRNVKFHNGRPVTARDVKYSVERACDPATGSRVASSYLGDIASALDKLGGRASEVSGVEVLDDYTLRITTDASKTYFLAKLTYPTSFVVDREQVEGASAGWWQEANGTGPFWLEQFDSESIILRANDDFYRGRPSLDEVVYLLGGGGAVSQYETGQVDVAPVGATNIDRALDPSNPLHDDLVIVHALNIWYLAFNVAMPPFDDLKVRLAFAHATNKKALADVILNKMVEPAAGILSPGIPGYNEDLEGIPFDPDMALDMLDESRYADDLPSIVFTVTGQGGAGAVDEALAESYRQILGAEIEIQQMSWPRFLDGLDKRQFQMFSLGWIADYPDPENFFDLLFHSQSEYNHMTYRNPQVDALLEQARTESDRQTRLNLYQKVEEILVRDVAWIPLYHDIDYQLVKPYVKGLVISPQGFYFVENVVVEPH
jgi:oligopeptide transport system substrate-binding protein